VLYQLSYEIIAFSKAGAKISPHIPKNQPLSKKNTNEYSELPLKTLLTENKFRIAPTFVALFHPIHCFKPQTVTPRD
jgi:hypothetical protein